MARSEQQSALNHVNWVHQLLGSGRHPRASAAVNNSQKITQRPNPYAVSGIPPTKTVIRLVQNDTFGEVRALRLKHPQDKIACLNLANANYPGGGFMGGGRAQEEDLCHCSTLYPTLRQQFFPLGDDGLIYSPDVLVVKSRNADGTRTNLEEKDWYYVDIISCPGVSRPQLGPMEDVIGNDNDAITVQSYAKDSDRQLMWNKLNSIVSVAAQNKVQRLVLAALGCGKFANPVYDVALMMKQLLVGSPNPATGNSAVPDWASFGLVEIVIAIFDPDPLQPVWNGFMTEFRQGQGFHTTDGVPVPLEEIQYTTFPTDYN